jgi:hydrogenase maturation protein HypF
VAGVDLVRAVVEDLLAGADTGLVAARFHHGLSGAVVAGCLHAREHTGLTTIALSGGVWQNMLLLGTCVDALETAGFTVLVHHRVPTNDGGISLGQAAVAAATT